MGRKIIDALIAMIVLLKKRLIIMDVMDSLTVTHLGIMVYAELKYSLMF
jgi:hypothetical protein